MSRNYKRVPVRLSEAEYLELKKKAKQCGLKMDPMMRKLILETDIRARPPNEYVQLVREINYIGNNINQIAHIANATGTISQEQIEEVKKNQNEIIKLMRGLR